MEEQLIHKEIHVSELFKRWPVLVAFFLDQKLDCVGCSLKRFCTVEDVVTSYDFISDDFIPALNAQIQAQADEKTSNGRG